MAKPIAVQTSDTLEASCWCVTYMHRYMAGEYAPHYPTPCTFGQVLITSRNVYRANPQGWDSEAYLKARP